MPVDMEACSSSQPTSPLPTGRGGWLARCSRNAIQSAAEGCRTGGKISERREPPRAMGRTGRECENLAVFGPAIFVHNRKRCQSFGHLNNVAYMRYFESGRMAYFDQILKPHLTREEYHDFIAARGIGPIVKTVTMKYRAPCVYPDTVTVGVRIDPKSVKADRFVQTAIIVSHAQKRVIAEAECHVVTYDYVEKQKADLPEEILEAWRKGEGLKE
ncbi:unnamed protein product [Sphagnum tenellum]